MWYYVIYWYKTKTKNTAVFPAYIAQNESEESYMYSYLKKKITGSGEASAQILKKRKLLYLMHKNPLPIAKKIIKSICSIHLCLLKHVQQTEMSAA